MRRGLPRFRDGFPSGLLSVPGSGGVGSWARGRPEWVPKRWIPRRNAGLVLLSAKRLAPPLAGLMMER